MTVGFFFVVAALFLVQALLGGAIEHYRADLSTFFGIDLAEVLPFNEAEAERERRAKVINARGELQAAADLRDAAKILSESPASLQLRYLQTLLELGADHNSTVVNA